MQKFLNLLDKKIVQFCNRIIGYLVENRYIIAVVALIALCAYGFELFNLNLTIDEEIAARLTGANRAWISQGRWGMYLLNRYLLPFNVIPFIPLFLALSFHIGAVLLLMTNLEITDKFDKLIIASIAIAYPGIAYVYTFSTLNYGIGVGFFCIALSLFAFINSQGLRKSVAILPACFAISIYQGLFPALLSIYLLYIIKTWAVPGTKKFRTLLNVFAICTSAVVLYYVIQRLFVVVAQMPTSGYVEQFFNFGYLIENGRETISMLAPFIVKVYSGDKSIYGQEIQMLLVFLVALSVGVVINIWRSKTSLQIKVQALLFSILYLFLPFVSGLFTSGYLAMRFLVCLTITISGWVILGLTNNSRIYKALVGVLAVICLLQFVVSSNHLFASSSLALDKDRSIGSQLIDRIEDQEDENNTDVKYLELVGYLYNPSTTLITKSETFGASFFEWDQGNVWRVIMFLETLGYNELSALPSDRRSQVVEDAMIMPIWPEWGSVKVIDDAVIVKFGPYSYSQEQSICAGSQDLVPLQNLGLCLK